MSDPTPPAVSEAMREAVVRCECGAEIDPNAVFEPGVCDPCSARRFNEEAGAHRNPAPPPIPVRGRFYMICCEHCDWVGSSEQCGTDAGRDDSDVYCPVCCQSMLCEEPGESDTAKHGQAVFDRIENQASEIARLTGENSALTDEANADLERRLADRCRITELEADVARLTGERDAARELAGLTWTAPDVDAVGRWAEDKGAAGIRDRMNRLFRRATAAEEQVRQLLNDADRAGQDHATVADDRAEAAEAETARLRAERDDLIGALEDTRAAADDLVPVCLVEGDNKAAGALQFVSGFISDRLAALTSQEQADV